MSDANLTAEQPQPDTRVKFDALAVQLIVRADNLRDVAPGAIRYVYKSAKGFYVWNGKHPNLKADPDEVQTYLKADADGFVIGVSAYEQA